MMKFCLAHMYPDLMNLYGDRGNLICLQKRLQWYGFSCDIKSIYLGDRLDFDQIDMIFMGGGSDREQGLVYEDLVEKADQLHREIEAGLPMLCICGAYQLLGAYYQSHEGQVMQGLGFFPFHTEGRKDRLIGNILLEAEIDGVITTLVGFENHGGRTYFRDPGLQPLGQVVVGYGNNGEDKNEGMRFGNLIGTYLHGPLLPKNPLLADFFIKNMAARKGVELNRCLDDSIEHIAHEQVRKMILSAK
ncbi:MAG: glutamine amidotransferase [Syntrophomonadaceae bacterium]